MPASVRKAARRAQAPILVTGMPRSGTTWLARLFATASGAALGGREPMNPRGRQYALARTLPGWTELTSVTAKQRRAMRLAYRGANPMVFSRYGRRQWAAPLPWTRVVVKDPFAMLSIPVIVATTGAIPVLVYRHPAAALVSYRRMGWRPDLAELRPVLERHRARFGTQGTSLPDVEDTDPAQAMGLFWSALYEIALDNAAELPDLVVVSHEELAVAQPRAAQDLFTALGLRWSRWSAAELSAEGETAPKKASHALHDLNRSPRDAAAAWHSQVAADDLDKIETLTAPIMGRLDQVRYRVAS